MVTLISMLLICVLPERPSIPIDSTTAEVLKKWIEEQPKKDRTEYWSAKLKIAKAAKVKRNLNVPIIEGKSLIFRDANEKQRLNERVGWHLALAKLYDASPGMTPETIEQLKLGLTVHEVEAILGEPGRMVSDASRSRGGNSAAFAGEASALGPPSVTLYNEFEFGGMIITFKNGKVDSL